MRGRKPKPKAFKLLEGTYRSERDHGRQPEPEVIQHDMPADLDGPAAQKWRELAPKLEALGVLTELDGDLFEAYCRAHGRYLKANERLDALAAGDVDATSIRKGEISVEKAEGSMKALGSEFGLSPSSRSRLSLPDPPHEPDPMERVLRGKK